MHSKRRFASRPEASLLEIRYGPVAARAYNPRKPCPRLRPRSMCLSRISLTIPLDFTACESCHEDIWIGWEECRHCGAAREPGTEDEAHLYRARVAVFEPLARATREVNPTGSVPVTDAQYVRYVNGARAVDDEQLEEITEAANALALEDVGSTRSVETRRAAQRLQRNADRCRRTLMDLKAIKPTGRFAEAHTHIVRIIEGIQRILSEIAQALTAWHPRDAHLHADAVQGAWDDVEEESTLAHERWKEATEDLELQDTPETRMESLTGSRAAGEMRTLSDLSAMGFGDFGGFMSRGPEGYRYFSDLLRTPLEDMPDEVPPALYMLTLLVNSFDDPAGIRSRAALFLEVLHEAHAEDGAAMLDAAVRVQGSLGEAGATLSHIGPLIEALLHAPGVPEESLRTFLLDTYKNLTEGCFKHVANLFLFAMFVGKGSPKTWESVADWPTFGDKYQWLKDRGDAPPSVAALEGVEKIVRNSAAHCDYEQLEGGVRLARTDPRDGTKSSSPAKTEKVLDDEEFGDLVAELMRTILSLSIAAQLFQLDHMREISKELHEVGTHRALRPTFLQLFLGIFGLVNPSVSVEGTRTRATASVAEYRTLSPVDDYFKALFFVGTLYDESEDVDLTVEHRGEWYCSASASNEKLRAVARDPNPATILALLLSAEVSSAGTSARTDDEKLRELGLSVGSRLLVNHLVNEVEPLLLDADPHATEVVRRTAKMLDDFKAALLMPKDVSKGARRRRDRLVAAVVEMRRYFMTNLRVRTGILKDAHAVARAQRRYQGGAGVLNEVVGSSPILERVF